MRYLLLVLMLTGCNLDVPVKLKYSAGNYSAVVYEAFEGHVDGVATVYRFGAGFFDCNAADNFVYIFDTGGAVINSDSSQVTCTTDLFTFAESSQDNRQVARVQ